MGSNNTAARNLFTWTITSIGPGGNQVEAGVWFQRIQSNDLLAQYQYGQASFSTLAVVSAGNGEDIHGGAFANGTGLAIDSDRGICGRHVQDFVAAGSAGRIQIGVDKWWNEVQGRASNYV